MTRSIRDVLLSPYWAAELLSQAKSFQSNPLIGSRRLNEAGLHELRLRGAHGISGFRRRLLARLVAPEIRARFDRDGALALPNFLAPDAFRRLDAEIRASRLPSREMIQGDAITRSAILDGAALRALPETARLLGDPRLLGLASYAGTRWKHPLAMILAVKNHYVGGRPDPQRHFHADTFHPTMKAWLFLDEVTAENAPFTYVPGSHRLTPGRLAWEREKALGLCGGPGRNDAERLSSRGSFRATEADLERMGYAAPHPFAVPPNTLVIADTHGFHRRGDAESRSSRLSLYLSSRSNPFNPWPGAPLRAWRALEHEIRKAQWRVADRRAEHAGRKSTWRPIPPEALFE